MCGWQLRSANQVGLVFWRWSRQGFVLVVHHTSPELVALLLDWLDCLLDCLVHRLVGSATPTWQARALHTSAAPFGAWYDCGPPEHAKQLSGRVQHRGGRNKDERFCQQRLFVPYCSLFGKSGIHDTSPAPHPGIQDAQVVLHCSLLFAEVLAADPFSRCGVSARQQS